LVKICPICGEAGKIEELEEMCEEYIAAIQLAG